MALTVSPLSYRSVTIVDPITGNQATVVAGALTVSSSGGGGGSVTQGTVPWVVSGQGAAGTAATGVVTIQGIAGMTKVLVTPDSVALPANQSVNVAQVNGVTTTMGNGVSGTGVQRVTIASDSTGQIALASGSQIQSVPGTSGGLLTYHRIATNDTTGQVVKNSAGMLYTVVLSNISVTTGGFLKLYDASSAPTAGTNPKFILPIPAPASGNGGATFSFPPGVTFGTGISYCFTTGITDADTTAPAASTYSIDIFYK